jgi:L-fucose isomerase-like protein
MKYKTGKDRNFFCGGYRCQTYRCCDFKNKGSTIQLFNFSTIQLNPLFLQKRKAMIFQLVLYSPFEKEAQLISRWGKPLNGLFSEYGSSIQLLGYFNDPNQLEKQIKSLSGKPEALILVIGSGGTERLAKQAIELLPCPVMLLANNRNNSLAAAIEINAVVSQTRPVKLVYAPAGASIHEQIKAFLRAALAFSRIHSARLGAVGEPSHWLLSSDGVSDFGPFGTQLVKIPIQELVEEYEILEEASADEIKEAVRQKAAKVLIKDEALGDASRVYLAMQQIIGRYRLDGITIRCFDLLEHRFTACLGMGLTNDQGIVASCEGDLHASFSMLVARLLTGEPAWMANPSSIDAGENLLTLAHCTVPFKMLAGAEDTTLTTHMESDLSVGIGGSLRKEPVTIFRTGKDFRSLNAITGQIIETNMGDQALCRTQAIIKTDTSLMEWMQKTPGNHQALVYGNIIPELSDFCRFAGVELIL